MDELISVIVPIYNVEKYICKCVDSILNQTYKNLEIILVDDGSPGRCGQICDEYAAKDSRIRVIHKENGGLSDARNVGIDEAKGEYLSFVDSDDYIAFDMIETLYKTMKENSSDMSVCSLCYVDENGNDITRDSSKWMILNNQQYTSEQYLLALFEKFIGAVARLYKRELFENVRFPKGKLHEDVFVAYRIIDQCNKISTLSKQMYYYLKRDDSIMNCEYDIRRLDAVEAYLETAEYCKRKNYSKAVYKTINLAMGRLQEGFLKLNLKDEENRKKSNYYYKRIKKLYHIQMLKGLSLKEKILFVNFIINPIWYRFVMLWWMKLKHMK